MTCIERRQPSRARARQTASSASPPVWRTFSLKYPTRDEQGTRDRPYDLIVDFDEKKIDDLLKALGLKPWLSHRPVIAVFVEMQQGSRKYIVTADAKQSEF